MEENIMERDFKGIWIPASVYCDKRLNALEKIIFATISELHNDTDGCTESNRELANYCQCSETKVSLAISKLIMYQYLKLDGFDGRRRVLRKCDK